MKNIKCFVITDWGGGIKHPSVSVFDTKKDAIKELETLDKMPDPTNKGKRNRIVKAELRWCERCLGRGNACSDCVI